MPHCLLLLYSWIYTLAIYSKQKTKTGQLSWNPVHSIWTLLAYLVGLHYLRAILMFIRDSCSVWFNLNITLCTERIFKYVSVLAKTASWHNELIIRNKTILHHAPLPALSAYFGTLNHGKHAPAEWQMSCIHKVMFL